MQLWLIDANLPDGSGATCSRACAPTAPATPALAHTASRDRVRLDALIDAGFVEVLVKPLRCGRTAGGRATRTAAARRAGGVDAATLRASCRSGTTQRRVSALNGNHAHVAALRRLFLDELPAQRDAVLSALRADDDQAAMRDAASPAGQLRLRRRRATGRSRACTCSSDPRSGMPATISRMRSRTRLLGDRRMPTASGSD